MNIDRAPASPTASAEAAKVLRAKTALLPEDFARLDREAKKRAITVTGEVSLDVVRSMRDALARAKANGVLYAEFVKTMPEELRARWGLDSPQLKTVFVNNVQQSANQAIVASLNRQRARYPYWTLDIVDDEVTSSYCSYFETHPVVLPAGHAWFATNAPMRHHRCRSTLRGLTAAEAQKMGITRTPPDWPAQDGWGGSAPLGAYKATMADAESTTLMLADRYAHIDFAVPAGVREEAQRGLDWRKEHGRGGTDVGVATARTLVSAARVSPAKARHIAKYFPRHEVDKRAEGWSPGEDGFPSNGRIAWALWGGDAGRAWSAKLVRQIESADRKAKQMKDKNVTADNGQGDVHADAPIAGPVRGGKRKLAEISTKNRNALPDSAFALPSKRKFPVHDASHARNAMARLEQVKGRLTSAEYAEAKRNIVKAYKRFGITPSKAASAPGARPMAHPSRRGFALRIVRPGGEHIEVRHMADGRSFFCGHVEINAKTLDAQEGESEPPKLVWNQIAKCGAFKGHPAGPFELTPQIFEEITQNFRATRNQRIPIDFEHASEQDPTSGAIPREGAPAQGWIVDLDNRGYDGLWGLVEWLEPARSYVRQGKYRFFSPAIRFGAKDRVSGQPIGARMTSGALTNNPFLDGMVPLAASDRGTGQAVATQEMTMITTMGDYCYSAAEVMPKLRAGLFGLDAHKAQMATLAECYDAVCRLESLADEFREQNPDADMMTATHHGAPLGAELTRLRDAMQMGMGVKVPELLALVKEMIAQALGEAVEDLEEDEDEEEAPSMRGGSGGHEMNDKDRTIALTNENATLTAKLRDAEAQTVTLADRVKVLETENARLMSEAKVRAEQDEKVAIEAAFATYKDVKKLSDGDKGGWMLTLYRANRSQFDTTFPPVAANQRHLMNNVSQAPSPGTQAQMPGAWPVMMSGYAGMATQVNPADHRLGFPQYMPTPAMGAPVPTMFDPRAYAEKLHTLSEAKIKAGMPREQAIVAARAELMAPPAQHT